ncbi:hemolysin family protein [Streptomyces sp. NBC_00838]|uniref:hemolysin family protein n=1 Tax=Streptomyces sp. NBC_00838 TaxID=2903680 RepID=UPI00386B72A2|nr:hemolysin family protein [Streptomyces sp. NBC_00838]
MTALQLAIGAFTLLTNAFFVGAEFALISVRRSQIEPAALKGNTRARNTLWGLEHLSAAMATAQLGITISSLVLGAVAEPAIAHLLEPPFESIGVPDGLVHPIAFVIALTLATYLHMLIGEMIPKNIALAAPARTALILAPSLVALTRGLRPVIFGINAFANVLLRLMKVEPKDEVAAVFTDDELVRMVKGSSDAGLIEPADGERLRDALELGTRPVGEVMVPLARTVTVPHDVTPRLLERAAATAGFSRLPVTGPEGDVRGYLHIKDTLGVTERDLPLPATALRPVVRVETDTPLDDAMNAMRSAGTHLAAVAGGTGAVVGFVTMEDLLEELVGPAADDG